MQTIKGYYDNTLKHSKYISDVIGLTDNKTLNYWLKVLRDESMCQPLEPAPSYPLFTRQNITKYLFASCSIYIIHRATKSITSEINKRYMRARHWLKIHEWSCNHPELYILVPLHSLLSPFIYFHYLFKFSWSIICFNHKQSMHSTKIDTVSKRSTLFKVCGILIGSYLYWVSFTNWSAKQLLNRNLSIHSWSTNKALQSIDIEEEKWRNAISMILYAHFEEINELSDIVLQFIGRSDIFEGEQKILEESKYLNDITYSNNRRRAFRLRCGDTFTRYKHLISCIILSVESVPYLLLLWKLIRCEDNVYQTYYDKLDDWHNQFDNEYDDEEWIIQKWIKGMINKLWRYLFVDRRIPFSKYIVLTKDYISKWIMDRDNNRFLRDNYLLSCMCVLWCRINYLIVEEMTYTYQY